MTLLLIPAIWMLALALVVGLCMAARAGDRDTIVLESVLGSGSSPRTLPEGGELLARGESASVHQGERVPSLTYEDIAA